MTPEMISTCEKEVIALFAQDFPNTRVFMSGQAVSDRVSVYARFFVVASEDVLPVGVGSNAKSRNVGIIQLTVYGPRDQGAGETGDIAHTFAKRFSRESFSVPEEGGYLTFKDGSTKDMKVQSEEQVYVARVPYSYDFNIK